MRDDYDVSYGDIEVTDKFQLGCWERCALRSVCAAVTTKRATRTSTLPVLVRLLALLCRRNLSGNLHLIGAARYSVLFGNDSVFAERETNTIGEIQLGTEYRRCMCGTSEMFLRSAL